MFLGGNNNKRHMVSSLMHDRQRLYQVCLHYPTINCR
nr:hypothetical protein I308_03384 [Cryptococcus tetragattii IND107]